MVKVVAALRRWQGRPTQTKKDAMPSLTDYQQLLTQVCPEPIRVLDTAAKYRKEQVRCRIALRKRVKAQRDELKQEKKDAWSLYLQTRKQIKKANLVLSANLCQAITDSDIAVATSNDQTLGNPEPTPPLRHCLHCGTPFQSLRPRKFHTDACRQAAYRMRLVTEEEK